MYIATAASTEASVGSVTTPLNTSTRMPASFSDVSIGSVSPSLWSMPSVITSAAVPLSPRAIEPASLALPTPNTICDIGPKRKSFSQLILSSDGPV